MASAKSSPHITTAEELLNAPSELGRCELVRGNLVLTGPESARHGATGARIGARLLDFVDRNELGIVFGSSAGYILSRNPDTVREPDVSFVGTERLKDLDLDAFLEGAPDLAVEVLSPSNTTAEMDAKRIDYFKAGCRVLWVVDPQRKSVAIYRPGATPTVLGEDDTLVEETLLPGFSVAVREIFPPV